MLYRKTNKISLLINLINWILSFFFFFCNRNIGENEWNKLWKKQLINIYEVQKLAKLGIGKSFALV